MFLVGFFVGLLVGWNFLEQPEIVKTKVDKSVEWIKKKLKL